MLCAKQFYLFFNRIEDTGFRRLEMVMRALRYGSVDDQGKLNANLESNEKLIWNQGILNRKLLVVGFGNA